MDNDSEEKILEDWNKSEEPDLLVRAFGMAEKHEPETDIENLYRTFKAYAKRHGVKREVPQTEDLEFKKTLRNTNKELMDFWIRLKRWWKSKKRA